MQPGQKSNSPFWTSPDARYFARRGLEMYTNQRYKGKRSTQIRATLSQAVDLVWWKMGNVVSCPFQSFFWLHYSLLSIYTYILLTVERLDYMFAQSTDFRASKIEYPHRSDPKEQEILHQSSIDHRCVWHCFGVCGRGQTGIHEKSTHPPDFGGYR